jgi:ABC-type transporter Mla subunit MlaD
MSTWGEVFLGIIAVATLLTGVFHLGLTIATLRMMKRMNQLTDRVEDAIQPTVARLDKFVDQAAHFVGRANTQLERAEVMFDDIGEQASRVSSTLRSFVTMPKRESSALAAGARAAFSTLTHGRPAADGRHDPL